MFLLVPAYAQIVQDKGPLNSCVCVILSTLLSHDVSVNIDLAKSLSFRENYWRSKLFMCWIANSVRPSRTHCPFFVACVC